MKFRAGLLLSAALLFLTACQQSSSESEPENINPVTGNVTLTVFDVGKADAMILQTENSVTVIDAGNKGDGKQIEKYLEAQGIDTIDTMIITHFDKDHVGGAARLVNRMNITTLYAPDYQSANEDYIEFYSKIKEKEQPYTMLKTAETVTWTQDDATFTLYAPCEVFYGKNEENDFSLCLYVEHGSNTLLFPGDAEEARQTELMNLGLGKVTFMKYPYHGNYLPTSEQFLDAFQPDYTVVCCSKKEYADTSTVDTLANRGIQALYTPNGTVTVVSDGKTIDMTQAEPEKKK